MNISLEVDHGIKDCFVVDSTSIFRFHFRFSRSFVAYIVQIVVRIKMSVCLYVKRDLKC